MALHTIEICAGVGMLGEGLRAGFSYMGGETRTVCYIEREAYASAVLVSRIEEGSLDEAPIWSDLLTFDGQPWRGKVDCIVAGFPCQDLSLAGKRAGLDGARSGLFFNILDIADSCSARFMFLENVAGIATATASVMDAAEGELDERAASRIMGELADRGWNSEWLTLSASEVGASHGRARWFCWAWRRELDNATSDRHLQWRGFDNFCKADEGQRGALQRVVSSSGGAELDDPGCMQQHEGRDQNQPGIAAVCSDQKDYWAADRGGELANASGERSAAWLSRQNNWQKGDSGVAIDDSSIGLFAPGPGDSMGHADQQRTHGCRAPGQQARGAEFADSDIGLFAPGPSNPAWGQIIADNQHLAPALESDFCDLVDGLAFDMDDCRAQRLRCIGNGVVAAQAALAIVVLIGRAGFTANRPLSPCLCT